MNIIIISLILCLLNCSYTLSAPSTTLFPKRDTFNPTSAFNSAINATWSVFWNDQYQAFSENDPACSMTSTNNFTYTSVWNLAVAGKVIVESGDIFKTINVINNLYQYQNSQGWFATVPNSSESFVDDNCQVLWVFIEAYKLTSNAKYLSTANQLMQLIQQQWSNIGGVIWKVDSNYIASISTVEAALSAVKIYQYNQDDTLLTFANSCLGWLDEHLTDPADGFYYDGIDKNTWQVNKGKLTYTIGVAMSTYSYLYKYTNDLHYVLYAVKKAYGTLNSNVFLKSNGYWNNDLKYIHLLFAGFADVITMCGQKGYIANVVKQGEFIYNYDQLPNSLGSYLDFTNSQPLYNRYVQSTGDSSITMGSSNGGGGASENGYCGNQPKRSLLDNASAAQIFYQISRFY